MSIRTKYRYLLLLALCACEPQLIDDPIPLTSFAEMVININFPEYVELRNDGGFKGINSIGVRGVIVYRVNATTFRAYERNCSYHPNEAGSTVEVHVSRLYMIDHTCGSTFSMDQGIPTGGIAWQPLRQYRTTFIGSTLTITDEVIN